VWITGNEAEVGRSELLDEAE
jgi:hypothetical protein